MWTVNEVSKRTGVSVRTLHHYDAIGLLKPSRVTEAGYRLYDDTALRRLQNILMFRELQFPLKEIKAILDNPKFDPAEALGQQIHLLELRKAHIESLISFARELQWKHRQKGAFDMEEKHAMEFDVFDKKDIDRYAEEVKNAGALPGLMRNVWKRRDGKIPGSRRKPPVGSWRFLPGSAR